MCKVLPRSDWTAIPAKGNTGADEFDGLPNYRAEEVKGICVHWPGVNTVYANKNPASVFEGIRKNDMGAKGYGDIMYNLGVAQQVEGVYTLRGLTNKSAANGNASLNAQYVAILCLVGIEETPTDLLLNNLKDARKLVLGEYPNATAIVGHGDIRPGGTACPGKYLNALIKKADFWLDTQPAPVPEQKPPAPFVDNLPPAPLNPGDRNVNVTDLQNNLAYWGYYKVRVDGSYGPLTVAAVKQLQDDLRVQGKYRQAVDGKYGRYTRAAWVLLCKELWDIAHK